MRNLHLGFPSAAKVLALALVLFQGLATTSHSQPLLLLDTTFIHGAQAESRPNAVFPLPEKVPANWKTPVDYSGGTAHFRLEVLSKPTETAIQYQPCLNQTSQPTTRRGCALPETLAVPGVHTWSQPFSQWNNPLDWSVRPHAQVLILKDAYGTPIVPGATDWVGDPYLSLYYPMKVRFSAAVTAGGSAFPGWNGLIPVTAMVPPSGPAAPRSLSWTRSTADGFLEIRFLAAEAGLVELRLWDPGGRLLLTDAWRAEPGRQVRQLRMADRSGRGGTACFSGPLILDLRVSGRSWKKVLAPAS